MVLAVGLMSGTSLDGIDAALIESDGLAQVAPLAFVSEPYDPAFRRRLQSVLGGRGPVDTVERELTDRQVPVVERLLAGAGRRPEEIAVVGFHGQTVLHDPARRRTWQIGDGQRLAEALGIAVVADFRSADVAAGGEGAPLAPLYHAARAAGLDRPLAVLNLGGVGNVTWIGARKESGEDDLLAFDTGPGNALLDDWVSARTGQTFDEDGRLALAGAVDRPLLARLLDQEYFRRLPPKSLDRDAWDVSLLSGLATTDGAATLTAFTAASVAAALPLLPAPPRRWLVTGGGRRNPALLRALRDELGVEVEPVEAAGWNGDAVEAEAFAYLAVRSLAGLPLSLPGTTGVPAPQTGGRRFTPQRAA